MNIKFHKNFKKKYQKLSQKLQESVDEKITLFFQNPFHIDLHNHALKGKYQNYRSINITGDLRALYKELPDDEVVFVLIGTHSQLYKK